jgi:curved DNA-binding protein CbpA
MPLDAQQNHYQVLGVERTADERAIKKAYFGLVRKYPPERFPEEFKKVRAAYEVLSDPVARRRFDSLDRDYAEYGENAGAAMRAAADALKAGDEAKAREHLRNLLSQRPDLHEAREMLGHSLMRGRDLSGALAQFDDLVKLKPEDGRYHLWRGYALEAKEHEAIAEAAFRRAVELRPDDVETRMALANVLASRKRFDESIAQIREALGRLPDEPGPRLEVELRLVDVLLMKGGNEPKGSPALRELDALVARVVRDPDRELWRYVSSRLASLAAVLFARESYTAGNEILSRCRRLNPASPVEHPYPQWASLPLAELPERARRWLAARRAGPSSPTILLSRWGASLWGFLGAGALSVATAALFFHSPWSWGGAGYAFAAAFIVGSCVALALGLRAMWAAASSPLRPLVTVHPLYLLKTTSRHLAVYPLVHLGPVKVIRHTTNGVYTHTRVQMRFGKKTFETSMRDEAYAKGWADHVLATRQRLLDLLHHGYLEAEPEVGVLPPRLLRPTTGARRFRPRADRWLAGGAVAGLLLFAAAIPWNRRLVDERDFGVALGQGTLAAHARYLARHPSGRFASDARAECARIHERARSGFAMGTVPGAPGPSALLAGLEAMEKAGQETLPVAVSWDVQSEAGAPAPADEALDAALAEAGRTQRSRNLVGRLGRSLRQAGLGEVARVEARPIGASAPLGLDVHGRYVLGAGEFEAGPLRLRSLDIHWKAELRGAGGASLFTWETETSAPATLERPAPGPVVESGWRRAAYEAELDAACEEFATRLTGTLGLPGADPSDRDPRARSPYGAAGGDTAAGKGGRP